MTSSTNFPGPVKVQGRYVVTLSADGSSLVDGGGNPFPGSIRTGYAQSVLGTFGDSIANISSFTNHDLRQISGSMGSNSDRMGVALNALANGGFRISFNGGVSGETTTQMLARDAAGGSATRKAITDAATLGIKHLVFSAGINDLQNPTLPAGSSSAVIDAAVTASIVNLVKLCQRAMAMGITPHVPALLGYRYAAASGLATNSQANVATTQEAIRRWNVLAKATFVSAGTGLGYFYDSFVPSIVDGNGAWLAGLDQGDGLHPSENSTYLIYGPVAQNILFLEGISGTSPFAYPAGVNQFANADFSAATSGVATGASIYVTVGTGTLANSIVTFRGQQWQQTILTPTGVDGNGNCGVEIDLTYASPTAAQVIGSEVSVIIDDGAGGAAAGLFQYLVRSRSGAAFADTPLFNNVISPKVNRLAAIDRRFAPNPIVAPATVTPAILSVMALVQQATTPIRLMISRPRVVVLPTAY